MNGVLNLMENNDSPAFFIERNYRLDHPVDGRIPFLLKDWQKELLQIFETNQYVVIGKDRQVGMTKLLLAYAHWYAETHPKSTILIFGNNQRTVKNLFEEQFFFGDSISDSVYFTSSRGYKKFKNESQIHFLCEDYSYVRECDLIIGDEVDFCRDERLFNLLCSNDDYFISRNKHTKIISTSTSAPFRRFDMALHTDNPRVSKCYVGCSRNFNNEPPRLFKSPANSCENKEKKVFEIDVNKVSCDDLDKVLQKVKTALIKHSA